MPERLTNRLKERRTELGLTQAELAEKVGCTESTISKIESGRVIPSLPMLQRLIERVQPLGQLGRGRW